MIQSSKVLQKLYRSAAVATLAAVVSVGAVCAHAQYNPAPPPPVPQDQPQSRWPMSFTIDQGQLTIYQPQLTAFDGNKITGRAAVSVLKPGATDPVFGAIWMESRVSVDRDTRAVQILDINVTRVAFPDADAPTQQALTGALQTTLPGTTMHLTLDQLLAEVQVIQQERASAKEISNDPPRIMFVEHPAVLVQYDGQPKLTPAPNSNLLRADNTPFFVALDPASNTYFLKGGGRWFSAPNPLGPFQYVEQAPQPIAQLADDSGYKDPQTALSDIQAQAVQIIAATDPTEVIWTDGPEQLTPISNTDLLYLSNTDSDVFLHIDSQQIYVLLSGRWFSSASRNGPWTYVAPDALPADFKMIPPNSEKGDVLAHVAGTQQARDAVANSYIPQTAAIDRTNFDQPTVQYDGDPNFQQIQGTPLQYAVNTPNSIILFNGQYYCCSNAAWYVSNSPSGQWGLCTSVPQEIYAIPPSCPIYPCRYVYCYGYTQQVVYCGYLPGYSGCYPYGGVVVYGTGYRYHAWEGHNYYPRAFTYGFAAHYDAYSGHWGFRVGFTAGDSTGWFGDRTGTIARRGGWFGHGGYRPTYEHRDVDNRAPVEVRHDELNLYQRRKDIRPEDHRVQQDDHREVPAHDQHDQRNDVLTDENGNIYRKSMDGWEQRKGNQWVAAPEPKHNDDHKPQDEHHDDQRPPAEEHHDDHPGDVKPPPSEPKHDEHKVQTPPPEEKHDQPKGDQGKGQGNLNNDYKARVQGDQRQGSYPRDPAPAPPKSPPAPTPHNPPSGGGGGGGGQQNPQGQQNQGGQGGGQGQGQGGQGGNKVHH